MLRPIHFWQGLRQFATQAADRTCLFDEVTIFENYVDGKPFVGKAKPHSKEFRENAE
jgi:hypothetical protein